jgi:hypothetical protein
VSILPRKNNFSLLDTAARPVYPTLGVLMSAQGTDSQAEQKPVIGAYYNTLEQDAGLYIPLPSGSFDYFDIETGRHRCPRERQTYPFRR